MNYQFGVELRTRIRIEDADGSRANETAFSMWKDLLKGCPLEKVAEGDVLIDHADQEWSGNQFLHLASHYDLLYTFQIQVEAESVAQAKQEAPSHIARLLAGSDLAKRHCTCKANIVMGHVSTLGYADPDAPEYLAIKMENPQTILVDIRDEPVSRWPQWRQKALQKRYGEQYIHMRGLGNINRQVKGAPIVLRNPDGAIARLHELLLEGHSLVLLCACKYYDRCHRKTVYDLLMATLEGKLQTKRDTSIEYAMAYDQEMAPDGKEVLGILSSDERMWYEDERADEEDTHNDRDE